MQPIVSSPSPTAYLRFSVDTSVYSPTVLQKAAYWFTGPYFVSLQSASPSQVEVALRLKPGAAACENPEEAFRNQLLDQSLRETIAAQTEPLRNLIMAHALSKTALLHEEPPSSSHG